MRPQPKALIAERTGASAASIRALVDRGILREDVTRIERDAYTDTLGHGELVASQPLRLNAEQALAVRSLEASLAALVSDGLAEACERLPAASRAALLTHLRVAARHLPPPDALPDAPADGHSGDWCRLLESAADLEADPATLPLWRAAAAFALTQSGTVRKSLDKRNGFPTAKDGGSAEAKAAATGFLDGLTGRPREAAALAEVQRLPVTRYSEPQWQALRSIVVMLGAAASELEFVFAEAGAVDYVAVARAALTALGPDDEPTDLALGLDYRLSHLLVDEFQDTSAAQVALLERLTAGFSPGDGRTVFLVGDPMQSIYRFREADVGLFLRVRDRGLGELKPEALVLDMPVVVTFETFGEIALPLFKPAEG